MGTLTLVPRRGDRCKNGAVIIDVKPAWDSSGYIALCLWTEDRQSAEPYQRTVDPYVTWFVRVEDNGIICYQGHYHDQLSPAVDDFNSRL
jgi:hypothetical protein